MRETVAQVERLKISYGKVDAVIDVSFQLYQGEVLAVIGPNGSGKTSVVECLEGLRRPAGGRVEILGYDPQTSRRQLYRKIGVQLQEAEYPDHIRVKELCRLYAAFYQNPANWNLLLEQFGLAPKSDRMVSKLSGGEKQRLSILLALLPRPRILILDELTTGLDPEVRRGMWEGLKAIQKMGTTILLVSHYMNEVEFLADRLVYLEKGRSAFAGTQKEFRQFVKSRVPAAQWEEGLSLEETYLLISPKTGLLKLEDLL